MCIAYLALGVDPDWPLFVAANRDERHARPTRAAAPWQAHPTIIGGQDLEAGGTWFAVQRHGRFALLTNYRDTQAATGKERSRGELCSRFLMDLAISPAAYMEQVHRDADHYQGFNLIVGQWQADTAQFTCYYYSNKSGAAPQALTPGHYVLSNHLLNTPWPKSQRLLKHLQEHVEQQRYHDVDAVYTILRDEQKAPIDQLPETGLDTHIELLLSSPFIISENYGTRSSNVWAVNKSGHSVFNECSYDASGTETQRHSWPINFFS